MDEDERTARAVESEGGDDAPKRAAAFRRGRRVGGQADDATTVEQVTRLMDSAREGSADEPQPSDGATAEGATRLLDDAPDRDERTRLMTDLPDPAGRTVLMDVPDPDSAPAPASDLDAPSTDEAHGVLFPEVHPLSGEDLDPATATYFDEGLSHGAQLQESVPLGANAGAGARSTSHDESLGEVPGEGRSRSHARPAIAALFLVVALVLVGAGVSYAMELWGGRTVPSVAGKTQATATQDLESRGFTVSVEERPVDDGIGKAVETNPQAGTRQAEGSTITLVVGVARTIPQVTGMTLDEAKQALQDAGAENLEISYASSDEAEGTVIAVDPAEGSAFVSRDTVTVTIAQPYTVPYVMGKQEDAASQAVRDAGLVPHVTYVPSSKAAGTVVGVSPDQGTRIASGGAVELSVSQPQPDDIFHLLDYFTCDPKVLAAYLAQQGFGVQRSYVDGDGMAAALYASGDHGTLAITSTPFLAGLEQEGAGQDVLAQGTDFSGARLELAKGDIPAGADQLDDAAVRAVMTLCGFDNVKRTVNQDTINLPAGAKLPSDVTFTCAYGETDTGYCWTVLISKKNDEVSVVVTAAQTSLYNNYDLSGFGGSPCDLVAYADLTSR